MTNVGTFVSTGRSYPVGSEPFLSRLLLLLLLFKCEIAYGVESSYKISGKRPDLICVAAAAVGAIFALRCYHQHLR